MTLLVPNGAEADMIAAIVNKTAPENLVLCLYTNNVTPSEADTVATYTEAAGNGYANKALAGASWNVAEGAPAVADYAQQTFTFTGALGNVYGYFVKRTTSGRIQWAERFTDGPYNIQNNGDEIKVTPRFTLD